MSSSSLVSTISFLSWASLSLRLAYKGTSASVCLLYLSPNLVNYLSLSDFSVVRQTISKIELEEWPVPNTDFSLILLKMPWLGITLLVCLQESATSFFFFFFLPPINTTTVITIAINILLAVRKDN